VSPTQAEAFEKVDLIRLDEPRELTPAERALLDFLIAPRDCPELDELVARAKGVGYCACGCPSVTLGSDAPPLSPELMERLRTKDDRKGALEIRAEEDEAFGRQLEVTLHVLEGELIELEIWGAEADGELVTELPRVEHLRHYRGH
jgi:hypothetical protein